MQDDLFDAPASALPDGMLHRGWWSRDQQAAALSDIRRAVAEAPLFQPVMPRTGKPFSVRMTNFGDLGWVSDRDGGYRYQATHPETGQPWPAIPDSILGVWQALAGAVPPPQACLVNYYTPTARMGLHQDRDEDDLTAPVVSVSLGDDARFRLGGAKRGGPTVSERLRSGDVVVLGGEHRLAFHGIDRIYAGTSDLLSGWLPEGGRINLTLRRVTKDA